MKSIKILLGVLAIAAMGSAAYADDLHICFKQDGHGNRILLYRSEPSDVALYAGGTTVAVTPAPADYQSQNVQYQSAQNQSDASQCPTLGIQVTQSSHGNAPMFLYRQCGN